MLKRTVKISLCLLLHVSVQLDHPQGNSVAHNTARSTQVTAWNTCCHNAAYHTTMHFYWSTPHYCSFSTAQHKLPEDGPIGPKHVGANIEIF